MIPQRVAPGLPLQAPGGPPGDGVDSGGDSGGDDGTTQINMSTDAGNHMGSNGARFCNLIQKMQDGLHGVTSRK